MFRGKYKDYLVGYVNIGGNKGYYMVGCIIGTYSTGEIRITCTHV